MTKVIFLAAVLAATLQAPVRAEEPRSVPVAHADLKLDRGKDVRKLDLRIARAARQACGYAPDYDLRGKNDALRCREAAIAAVGNSRTAAIEAARGVAVASVGR